MKCGDTFEVKRVFTKADVEKFVEISGDRNPPHITLNEKGQLVVHGLLTATLPSIVGGKLNVTGREFQVEWFKPVYTDDEVTCKIILDKIAYQETRTKVTAVFEIYNQSAEKVSSGHFFGLIYNVMQN